MDGASAVSHNRGFCPGISPQFPILSAFTSLWPDVCLLSATSHIYSSFSVFFAGLTTEIINSRTVFFSFFAKREYNTFYPMKATATRISVFGRRRLGQIGNWDEIFFKELSCNKQGYDILCSLIPHSPLFIDVQT